MFLVDTNVVSETARKRPDPGVLEWLARQPSIAIAAVSIQELSFGVEVAPPSRQALLREWLQALLSSGAIEILAFDARAALETGRLIARRQLAGQPIAVADAQIAGTAIASSAVLVTRNTRDFTGQGIPLLNPFQGG
jgi:toxin FitB